MSGYSRGEGARRLPARPNLEKLKKDAKDLLRAHRAQNAAAIDEVRSFHPSPSEF